MNVRYINPLLQSAINVLSTMASTEATMGEPRLKEHGNALGDITGVIDLAGTENRGSLAIAFPEAVILDIGGRMLGETLTAINETVIDMVGELTNMITGSAKALYAEQGMEFDLTLPRTVVGKGEPIEHCSPNDTVVLPFTTASGEFFVEFNFA